MEFKNKNSLELLNIYNVMTYKTFSSEGGFMEAILVLACILLCLAAYLKFKVNYIEIDSSEKVEMKINLAVETIIFSLFWVGILITLSIFIFVEDKAIIGGIISLILPCYFIYDLTIRTALTSKGITTVDIFGRRCRQQLDWDKIESCEITKENKLFFYYKSKGNKLLNLSIEVNKNQIEKIEEIVSKYLSCEILQM